MTDVHQLEEQLEESDWKRFEQPQNPRLHAHDEAKYHHSYQKRVRDEEGNTKYFITTHKFSSSVAERLLGQEEYFAAPDTQLNKGGVTFDVRMHRGTHDVEAIEAFFEDLWQDMEADYYEAFDGRQATQEEVRES